MYAHKSHLIVLNLYSSLAISLKVAWVKNNPPSNAIQLQENKAQYSYEHLWGMQYKVNDIICMIR